MKLTDSDSEVNPNVCFPRKLRDIFPDIVRRFTKEYPDFEDYISDLVITERCRCSMDECATVRCSSNRYINKPDGSYATDDSDIIIDVKNSKIVTVEILSSPDLRNELVKYYP